MSLLLFWIGDPGPPPPDPTDPSIYPPDHPNTGFVWYEDEESESPWDALGIPSEPFLEIVSTTQVRVFQIGLEPWVANDPVARVFQIGLEPWVANNPDVRIFQCGLEVWHTPNSALRRLVNVDLL